MALRWSGAGQIALCLVSAFGGVMSVCAQASLRAADFTDAVPSTRTVHFPHDRSMGTVHIRDWGHVSDGAGEMFCQARGDVVIPAGKAAILELSVQGPPPLLAPLAALGPNDLQGVRFGGALVGNADLAHLGALKGLQELEIVGGALGDDGLVHLSALTSLEYLKIAGGRLTGEGFAHLTGLRSLRTLVLGLNCTGEGLACLRDLPALRKLTLSSPQVTDTGTAEIAQLKSLVELDLSGASVTDAGLAYLTALSSLEKLSLSCRRLSDSGFQALGQMRSLRELSVHGARITDGLAGALSAIPQLASVTIAADSATSHGLAELAKLPALQSLSVSRDTIDDAALAHVGQMRSLKSLSLRATKISDSGLAHLKNLASLEVLRLGDTPISDAGLAHVAGLGALREIYLYRTRITDVGLAHLAGLHSLRTLHLWGTDVTDRGLAHLREMRSLEMLNLLGTKVTDAGLEHLAALRSLRNLNLGGTQITGTGLIHLQGLSQLQELDLSLTKVTDAALVHLRDLPSLRQLDLKGTKVGDAALDLFAHIPSLTSLAIEPEQLSTEGLERARAEPPRRVILARSYPGLATARVQRQTSLRPFAETRFPPDMERIFQTLEREDQGWRRKGRVVQQGVVSPGQFPPGKGLHVVFEETPAQTTQTKPLVQPRNVVHLWFMEPSYHPFPVRTDCADSSKTLYTGRTDTFQVFCRPEPMTKFTEIPNFVSFFFVQHEAHVELLIDAFQSNDRDLRRIAANDLYLFVMHGGVSSPLDSGGKSTRVMPAFAAALDRDLLEHLLRLLGDYETIHFLARYEGAVGMGQRFYLPADVLRQRPDVTESVYREIIRRAKADPEWFVGHNILSVLYRMAPPSPDEIQAALQLPPLGKYSYPLAFHKIAINHATVGRYAGLAYDIAPYLWCDDGFTREAALEYFQQVRSPHAATGLFRSLAEGRRSRKGDSPLFGGIAFFGREAVLFPSRQPPWPSRRDLTLDWIESGWPWRGNLDVFCTLPFSDELRALICDFLRRQDPSNLPEQYSPQHMALLLALNFLIRNPSPEALPGLLRILGDNSSRQQSASLTSSLGDRRTLWHEIAFNTGNLPEIAAAQAIMQLGAQASRPVLEYVNNQVSRVSGATPQKWSPSLFVGLLILGALADEQTYDGFQALGSQLQGTPYHKCWQTADQWYVQGGRQFHPPRPPRQSVVARVSGRPGPRTLRFPTYGRAGALLMRDWGSTPTAAWQPIAEAVGNVTVPSGKELKLVPEHRPPPATLFHKILNRVGFKIQPTAPPPDLKKLSRLHTDDLQVLDLSGHDLDNRQLAALKRLTELHRLDLHATPIGDKGLAHLKNLKSLEWLDLGATQVGDGGLAHLTALRNLRILDLSGTKVTDAGVQHLKRMTSLRTLCLGETPITRKALRELQEALPLCEIWK